MRYNPHPLTRKSPISERRVVVTDDHDECRHKGKEVRFLNESALSPGNTTVNSYEINSIHFMQTDASPLRKGLSQSLKYPHTFKFLE